MVEAMSASIEDYLINSISYKLKPGASYINERISSKRSKSLKYTGTKLIKLQLTCDNSCALLRFVLCSM